MEWTIVGTLASIAGLFLTIWVLFEAKGAKEAAQEARSLTRQKQLVEGEVVALCTVAANRWPDHLGVDSKNALLTTRAKIRSIAELTAQSSPLSERQWKNVSKAQLDASDLIGSALGVARRAEERSADD